MPRAVLGAQDIGSENVLTSTFFPRAVLGAKDIGSENVLTGTFSELGHRQGLEDEPRRTQAHAIGARGAEDRRPADLDPERPRRPPAHADAPMEIGAQYA